MVTALCGSRQCCSTQVRLIESLRSSQCQTLVCLCLRTVAVLNVLMGAQRSPLIIRSTNMMLSAYPLNAVLRLIFASALTLSGVYLPTSLYRRSLFAPTNFATTYRPVFVRFHGEPSAPKIKMNISTSTAEVILYDLSCSPVNLPHLAG